MEQSSRLDSEEVQTSGGTFTQDRGPGESIWSEITAAGLLTRLISG